MSSFYSDEEDAEMLNNVDKYMHKVKLFRFPAWSLFIFVLLYGLAAAVLFTYYEDWTIWDSLYFTMIRCAEQANLHKL